MPELKNDVDYESYNLNLKIGCDLLPGRICRRCNGSEFREVLWIPSLDERGIPYESSFEPDSQSTLHLAICYDCGRLVTYQ